MDEFNPYLRSAILEVVDNQIRDNEPPETRQTLQRLMTEGHSRKEAKELIAAVVVSEMYEVLTEGQPFDRDRFVAALNKLPELPFDDED